MNGAGEYIKSALRNFRCVHRSQLILNLRHSKHHIRNDGGILGESSEYSQESA